MDHGPGSIRVSGLEIEPLPSREMLTMEQTKMSKTLDPRTVALTSHRDYYAAGSYADDRLKWTIETFLPDRQLGKVLEIGCGDGAMLRLLAEHNRDVTGVDASYSGIEKCHARGLSAQWLDVSTDVLPFEDNQFDVVISLETFEHLMNPHHALHEVRRTLRPGGRFICSIPNPLSGHPYLYPGLFDYANFRRFLEQSDLSIRKVAPWQWVPRETFLPSSFRNVPILRSRIVAGGLRKMVEKIYLAVGGFPAFCYWLWTFDCRNEKTDQNNVFEYLSQQTRPKAPLQSTKGK